MGRSGSGDPMNVDSYRFLPRSFRPYYEGRGPFPGEEEPVWAPFPKRLSEARIGLLTSAGLYVKGSQPGFDVERERANPEWGDPGLTRLLLERARAGTMDRKSGNLHGRGDDDAVGG